MFQKASLILNDNLLSCNNRQIDLNDILLSCNDRQNALERLQERLHDIPRNLRSVAGALSAHCESFQINQCPLDYCSRVCC